MVSAPSTPRSVDPLTPGLRIGPYLLLVPLGSGGSSRVWAVARTGQLGFTKRMALKVMRQDKLSSERARQRFDREARLGAQLRHANLRAVHELGSHAGRPHMALAWVDTSLAELLEHAPGKRLEPEVVCWFGIQACSALAAAHAHQNPAGEPWPIVHGDVSPGNILLTSSGHVLLADLAAAADPSPSAAPEQSASKIFFGSLGYASPEALRGLRVDGRSDLFSLGCVLYEALCGAPAFEADDERSLLFQVLEQGPIDLAIRCPELPADLGRVLRRALARSVEERFASAEEMRQALCACVPELTSFALERRSTALIGRVLGERIRQREEEMRLTFQRFAPSQLERTDTLPIGNSTRRRDSTTLRTSLAEAPATQPDVGVAEPRGVVATAEPQPRRRMFWLMALATPALLASLYVGWSRQRAPAASPSVASSRATNGGPPDPGELSLQLQGLQAQPRESPSGTSQPSAGSARASSTPAPAESGSRRSGAALPAADSRGSRTAPLLQPKGAARGQRLPARVPALSAFHPPQNPYQDELKPKPKPLPLKSAPPP